MGWQDSKTRCPATKAETCILSLEPIWKRERANSIKLLSDLHMRAMAFVGKAHRQ